MKPEKKSQQQAVGRPKIQQTDEKLQTEGPLSEKDEVKEAENRAFKALKASRKV